MIVADDTKVAAAILIAAFALAGVILTAVVSFLVSRRTTYLNTVTVERSKWIDKLRDNISQVISQAHALDMLLYRDEKFHESKEYLAASTEIVRSLALVRLQLNPDGEVDANILSLLTAIQDHIGTQDYKNLERLFVRHVQWLLKEEWEKVKFEARGWVGRLVATYKKWRRRLAYRKFCAEDGSIDIWVSSN